MTPRSEIRKPTLMEAEMVATDRVRDFKDLIVWQLARELHMMIYGLVERFPAEERYALNTQIRRAAQSVGANIAEGFGRYSHKENIQFCRRARGSAFELRDRIVTAADAGFVTEEEYDQAEALARRVIQTINGYVRATDNRLSGQKEDN